MADLGAGAAAEMAETLRVELAAGAVRTDAARPGSCCARC